MQIDPTLPALIFNIGYLFVGFVGGVGWSALRHRHRRR